MRVAAVGVQCNFRFRSSRTTRKPPRRRVRAAPGAAFLRSAYLKMRTPGTRDDSSSLSRHAPGSSGARAMMSFTRTALICGGSRARSRRFSRSSWRAAPVRTGRDVLMSWGDSIRRTVSQCVARGFRDLAVAVLHQCIRPLIGAFAAPGHHGYQRACDLISGQASIGAIWVTSVRMRREDRTSISSHPLADLGR